jgi:hypothetical protein
MFSKQDPPSNCKKVMTYPGYADLETPVIVESAHVPPGQYSCFIDQDDGIGRISHGFWQEVRKTQRRQVPID